MGIEWPPFCLIFMTFSHYFHPYTSNIRGSAQFLTKNYYHPRFSAQSTMDLQISTTPSIAIERLIINRKNEIRIEDLGSLFWISWIGFRHKM